MSKYDAELAGLDHCALLGRVRELLMRHQFSNRRHGRRANWMAGAIEEWAYLEQEAMIGVSDNPPASRLASQAHACRIFEQLSMHFECGLPDAPERNTERPDAHGKVRDLHYISGPGVAP